MRIPHCLIAPAAALALAACSDITEYHPYDGRIKGARGINERNIKRIETACAGKDTVCFAVMSDTQRAYDETSQIVGDINRRGGVDFVINLGDLTDFGETKEFTWMRDKMQKLRMPYVCLIGNHDCLATGEEVFTTIFGKVNFAFTAGRTRFVCLNTNSREYDHTTAVPDFKFINAEADSFPSAANATVVAMHAPPGSEQFDANVDDVFEYMIHRLPGLKFCLHGHTHHTSVADIFSDGTIYYGCANAAKLNYLVFRIYDGGYDYESVEL